MNQSELAKKFANGATEGKASNMYIDGDVIYSYGRHFPIARRLGPEEFVLTTDSKSMSTSGQKSTVRGALQGVVWEAPRADIELLPQYLIDETRRLQGAILMARTKLPRYIEGLEEIQKYWESAKKRFALKSEILDSELQFKSKPAIRAKMVAWRFEQATREAV